MDYELVFIISGVVIIFLGIIAFTIERIFSLKLKNDIYQIVCDNILNNEEWNILIFHSGTKQSFKITPTLARYINVKHGDSILYSDIMRILSVLELQDSIETIIEKRGQYEKYK